MNKILKQMHCGLKKGYRACAPMAFRGSREADVLKSLLYKIVPKSVIYDRDFLLEVIDQPSTAAAPVIAASVVRDLAPTSILDVGCGSGSMLLAFRDLGLSTKGFEFAAPALSFCKDRMLDVIKVDLRNPDSEHLPRDFSVVLSMEVAEHLPRRSAEGYVELLCGSAPVVVFTAAPPGQGGTDHLNEQPMEYWIQLFEQKEYAPDKVLSDAWRREWDTSGKVTSWYTDNLMVFRSLEFLHPENVS